MHVKVRVSPHTVHLCSRLHWTPHQPGLTRNPTPFTFHRHLSHSYNHKSQEFTAPETLKAVTSDLLPRSHMRRWEHDALLHWYEADWRRREDMVLISPPVRHKSHVFEHGTASLSLSMAIIQYDSLFSCQTHFIPAVRTLSAPHQNSAVGIT